MPAWSPSRSKMSRGLWYWRGGSPVAPPCWGGPPAVGVWGGALAVVLAEPFVDVEGALGLAGGLVVVPAGLGEHAELVDPGGLAGRVRRQPGEGVIDQRGFLIPGAPGMQLGAG